MADKEVKKPQPLRERMPETKWMRVVFAIPIAAEWCLEWLNYGLGNMALFGVLGRVAQLSILFGVGSYFLGGEERRQAADDARKAKHYQAWQMILAAEGSPSGGGRTDALEDLVGDGVSLARINLSHAVLMRAQLSGASLNQAVMDSAFLNGADLSNSFLSGASLTYTSLITADLTDAWLNRANLTDTRLVRANLTGAKMWRARLAGAYFSNANLTRAELSGLVQWREVTSLDRANVWQVTDPPEGFLQWAISSMGAVCMADTTQWRQITNGEDEWGVDPDTVQNFEELCRAEITADST